MIALAAERFTKNLWSAREASARPLLVAVRDEAEQARYVVARVLENREAGLPLKSQAVLFRTSHHSDTLEFELTRRNIPFVKFGGLKFLEAAHVKDMLAALRFAENPRDRVAGFRVTQLVPGIGPASAARILDRLAAPDPAAMLVTYAPPRAGGEWQQLRRTVRRAVPPRVRLAGRVRAGAALVRAASRAPARRCGRARRRPRAARADRRELSVRASSSSPTSRSIRRRRRATRPARRCSTRTT